MFQPTCVLRGAFLLALSPGWLWAQELSEKELLALFRSRSPAAAEARARKAVAEAEARTRGLYANPSLQYSREGAGLTEFWQLEQALPIAGRQKAQRLAGEQAIRVTESEAAFSLWQAEGALRRSFLDVLVCQEREALLERARVTIGEVVRQLRDREREGEGSKYDRLRAEREAAGLAAELQAAQAETAVARGRVRGFLPAGVAFQKAIGALESSRKTLDASQLTTNAWARREDLNAERRRVQQFGLEAQAASRLRYPEPLAHAGLKRADISQPNRFSTGNGVAFGVSVPLPVFQNGKQQVAQFDAEAVRARARLEVMERQIAAQIEGLIEAYAGRVKARESFVAQVSEAGLELVRIARIAYEEGELGILQLLDAYRTQWQAELRGLELQAAVREVQLELERVIGEELPQ